MYLPTSEQLQGLSVDVAECLGKPHFGARYTTQNGINLYRMEDYARCMVCGKPATNVHHQPYRSKTKGIELGGYLCRPSLIALCGSGTTGCHGLVHAGKIRIRWRWVDDRFAAKWWRGTVQKNVRPHSEKLYQFGYWDVQVDEDDFRRIGDSHIFL